MDFDPKNIKQTIDKHGNQKGNVEGSKPEKTEPVTLSFEQLEKELKRLNDMKDKGLISEEEYKKARARLMEQAGIGK
ncbi:MAG: SHOCT domain-containing protein [Acidobacteria bacterium]|nr:SHOCT domain-containing protein [Acidobacteriota bacterium]